MAEENKEQKNQGQEKNIAESEEKKRGEKKQEKKKQEIKKKDAAVVRGKDLGISTKYSVAICKFIRGKKIDKAIEELEKVARKEKAIPMALEIPHRKGMERGRYPMKASKELIRLLKTLQANSQVNGLEEPIIATAVANKASQPFRRFGSERFKRTHVYLEAREKMKGEKKK